MALKQLQKNENGFVCPKCNNNLRFVDGGAVRIVNGKLDMDNAKSRYECDTCSLFYREVMNTGYYDVFPLEKQGDTGAPEVQKTDGQNQIARMKMFCPQCGHIMVPELDGKAAAAPAGFKKPDVLEATYTCDDCNTMYREAVMSGTRHTLAWYTPSAERMALKAKSATEAPKVMTAPAAAGKVIAAKVEPGQIIMPTKAEPKPEAEKDTASREVKATGDLPPMELKKDESGHCECPRCGGSMEYIEGQPVRIVDGKPTFDDVLDHFSCPDCKSVFRRIVGTNYFQFSEK